MARYQVDDEPLQFQQYVPGKVIVSQRAFYALCFFAGLGVIFLIMILFAS